MDDYVKKGKKRAPTTDGESTEDNVLQITTDKDKTIQDWADEADSTMVPATSSPTPKTSNNAR